MGQVRDSRIAEAERLVAGQPLAVALLPRYYRSVGEDDIVDRSAGQLADTVTRHLAVGLVRAEGTPAIAVDPLGVIDVVTDDMPFLVDSVTGALVRGGHDIALIVHPQLSVVRGTEGELESFGPGGTEESWIHVEVEPLSESECAQIAADVAAVLEDVRLAVQDWPEMRGRAAALAFALTAHPPAGVAPDEVHDACELLHWMADDHFTFVGYREYSLAEVDGEAVLQAQPGTALGVMRKDPTTSTSWANLSPEARVIALEPHLLVLTKANRRSTVHRRVYLDYVGVKKFDAQGRVVGEHRFVGLYGATAYTQSVLDVPVVARKVRQVLDRAQVRPDSHDGRDLLQILESYPRDELFEIHPERLSEITTEVLQLQERRQTRLLTRHDDFGRFASALVYLPRDRYTTSVREHMQEILREAYDAESVDFTARVTESVLARLHFLVRVPLGRELPRVDEDALERRLAAATESWEDRFVQALGDELPALDAAELREQFDDAFTEAYKEDFLPAAAVADALRLRELADDGGMSVQLYDSGVAGSRRFKVFRTGSAMSLSEMLPLLQDLGVGVVDERPYAVAHAGRQAWIYDFGLTLPVRPDADPAGADSLADRFQDAFLAAWEGRLDRGGFGALVVGAGLTWRQVALVQALMAYSRQLGSPFSQRYSEDVLVSHGSLVRSIVELFEARLGQQPRPEEWVDARLSEVRAQLDAIASLDEDRIVRSLLTIVLAVVRTNYFQRRDDGSVPEVISVKVLPALIPEAPRPRPEFEIWVHSPRVSGVHLRFGRVARGGLRWSDRRDDFRTEVLGLVKAQMVKNAVIVPVGAKGGFVCASLPDPSDREAWLAEGIACYRLFVSALLDITDNLVGGQVVPPAGVTRLDGDDPYLVVAADKGTATFSDIANELALARGFWLGDAFASGGSAGYDHKAMGITARGAWESVRRHFRSLGVDPQTEPITVVGIGDMSGDVFGNGMLLSEQIRLVAAFDHRHIFLDPSPDPAASFAERARLFALPRSSWADYDPAVVSPGGGVHPRTAKSIPLTTQVRDLLGLAEGVSELAPNDLLRALLQTPVDLLWNGGIGTYVKATAESNLDVGDKANDAIRVNGDHLRCRVVGEGGNLGLTQRGRVEAAQRGVLLNTDAIDNSAGVDTSDHEVNIKILVDAAVRDGALPVEDRTPLLESMTDEVAALVLRDNYEQNLLLSADLAEAVHRLPVHRRLIDEMEQRHELDRALEALPTDLELERRAAVGEGLVCPELAVLAAHVKITLTDGLLPAAMSSEPWFARLLAEYFPREVVQRLDRLEQHPLANEIVTMMVANTMVNRGGITYPFRVVEETGAAPIEVARAFLVATEVFGLPGLWARIEALDDVAPMAAQTMLLREARRLLDRATRWTLQTRGHRVDVDVEVATLRPVVAELSPRVPSLLRGAEAERLREATERYVAAGAPADLAAEVAALLYAFSLLDVVEVSRRTGGEAARVADLYFAASERFGGDLLLRRITALPRPDRWATLARAALRSDLYTALAALTARIDRATPEGLSPAARIDRWEARHAEGISRARGTLAEITALDSSDIATLSVALRSLRALVAQGGGAGAADVEAVPSE